MFWHLRIMKNLLFYAETLSIMKVWLADFCFTVLEFELNTLRILYHLIWWYSVGPITCFDGNTACDCIPKGSGAINASG